MRTALKTQNRLPYQGVLSVANLITDDMRLAGVQGDGATWPFGGAGVWPAATNLCTNGGFETNTTGWEAWASGASIARVTSESKFGGASLEVTVPDLPSRGTRFTLSLSATTAYTFSAWVKVPVGKTVQLVVYDTPATTALGTTVVPGTGDWQRASVTFTSDADGGNHTFYVMTYLDNNAVVFYVDGVQIETGSIATPYIHTDGGTASRTAGSIAMPADVLDETQMWVAFRMKMGYAYTQNPASPNGQLWFTWGDNGDGRRIGVLSTATGGIVRTQRYDGVTIASASTTGSWALGDDVVVLSGVSPTLVKIALNGGALQTAAHTAIPVIAATTAQIGGNGGVTALGSFPATATYYWVAAGKGPIDDAFSVLINSWGNNNPLAHQFPQSAQITFLAYLEGDGRAYRRAV